MGHGVETNLVTYFIINGHGNVPDFAESVLLCQFYSLHNHSNFSSTLIIIMTDEKITEQADEFFCACMFHSVCVV